MSEVSMNVAMCIPTYNRANVVEHTLGNGIEGYKKYGIDLYYYDSSTDNKTKEVVEKYINAGYDNIHYIAVEDGIRKAAMYYTGMGMKKQYDYIWPAKDRVWFEEPTLAAVEKAIEEDNDVVFLGVLWCFSHPGIGTKVYERPEEFYLDWGYLVTSIDVNIYKRESMLAGLSYEQINEYGYGFPQFQLMFEELAKGEKRVKALVGSDIISYNSNLVGSSWKKDVFLTWKDSWIAVNENLPDCYNDYKDIVIKQAGTLPWIFGTVNSLLEYKEVGALVPEKLDSILENWERVSDIPKEKVIAIANGTYDIRHDIDLVPENVDELLDLLVKMEGYFKAGIMRKEQIPYNDLFQGIMNRVIRRCNANNSVINIVAGSVEDTILYIRDKAETTEEITKAIQMLISIMILSI